MKAVIKGCIDAIESRSQVSSEEGLFEEIMNAGRARKSSTLPPAADSP
jgi:predicted nucleic acid-binding Zn ribbon protein